MGRIIVQAPVDAAAPGPLGPPPPPAVSEAEVSTVALAIEHLLVPGKLSYDRIVQLLAEGGVAPWLAVAGERGHGETSALFFSSFAWTRGGPTN